MNVDGLERALAEAVAAVRGAPTAIEPRMALFQLACVAGDWRRARGQLDTLASLDAEAIVLARVYGRLIDAEATRARVFEGREAPVALGPPAPWLAMLARALELDGRGEGGAAAELRGRASAAAEARPGTIDGERFEWVMDADPRLGPTLEVVVEGQYRWLPFAGLREFRAEPPGAARDLVWQPATLSLANGAELHAFVPTRYSGSEAHADDAVRLARATLWVEAAAGEQRGFGQRLLATDGGDHPLLDVRRLRLDEPAGVGGGIGPGRG